MLYSQNVKNVVSGVSQQPPILRLPEQLAEQINGFSTEMSGLQKRPPTCFVANLAMATVDTAEPLVHFVSRDRNERYIMYFYNNTIRIFDLEGNEKTVNISDGEYLETANPRDDLRVITIADYTFITNRTVEAAMAEDMSPDSFSTQGALIHVKQGQYGRTYKIWVNDALAASYTTPDGSASSHTTQIDTNYIANQLATSARSNGYTVDTGDCWLRIHGATKVATQDGFNNQAMIGVVSTVQKFSLLPATAPDGFTVRVVGDPNGSTAGSYYVAYDGEDKVWKETVKPNVPIKLDASTLPHVLVRESDNTFSFHAATWGERAVGDEDSNPPPSFVGNTINDIFFFRNRLGFLSGENVIMSESAEYFNFFMTTANDVQDTDPIDVSTTTERINILNYAVPFNEELYCFSDSTQFILRSDTTLSPKNVALVNTTGFNASPDCRPTVCGKNLYFPSARAEYTSIKEFYYVQSAADMRNAQDITAHVSSYIPNNVYAIIPSTNENIMLFLSDGDTSNIYVYKFLFQNEQRVQASWSRWDMGGAVFGACFIESTLYVLINRGGRHILEKTLFTYNTTDFEEEPYRVYLDCKKLVEGQTYDSVYERTQIDLTANYPWILNANCAVALVLADGTYKHYTAEEITEAGGIFYLDGDHSTESITIGIPYTFKAVFSPIYIRETDNSGNVRAVTNGRLQVRTVKLNYADTGGFIAYVTSHGHTYTYRMTARRLGRTQLDVPQSETGIFRIPIQCLNTNYELRLESDMPLPISLIGFLWEGSWAAKAKGV